MSAKDQQLDSVSLPQAKLKVCNELKEALAGDIGDIVSKHEEMILHYYHDVQVQAKQSFNSAKTISKIGFGVLIATLTYTLIFDALARFKVTNSILSLEDALTVGGIGVVSGLLIEFIAGVNFWLYGRAAKQFNAFHICLERTHRYLIAYKIGEKMRNNRDEILGELVCIMANAPMITSQDTNDARVKAGSSKAESA